MGQTGPTRAPRHHTPKLEQHALIKRREINDLDVNQPSIGLALSGGGVRSATFCIGLLRALAKNGVLHRFDYLSTVSGGGYAGSAFGRLFSAKANPKKVEEGLANDGSILLWWLRSNGRYLVPAGLRDVLQTWAGQLRGFIATQFEVTMLLALVSCVIVLPHLLGYRWDDSLFPTLTSTPWWVALPFVAWLATITAFGYWWSGDTDGKPHWSDFFISLLAAVIGAYLLKRAWIADGGWQGNGIMTVIGSILLAVPIARVSVAVHHTYPAKDRVRFTMGLSRWIKVILLLAALGASDLLTWFLADKVGTTTRHGSVFTSAGLAAMLIAVARFTLPLLHARGDKNSKTQLPLALIANLCGMLLVVMLALFWLCALQYFVFVARVSALDSWMHWLAVLMPSIVHMRNIDAWLRWGTVAAACAAYVVLTGSNLELINRSSLHAFYRSRIARTYVSVGNSPDAAKKSHEKGAKESADLPRFPASPLKSPIHGQTSKVQKLTELLQDDDIELTHYSPHDFGGPIHLINCCINQTIDDRTDTYNADRKGVYLTVSSLGVESGTQLTPSPTDSNPLSKTTLAEWIAISGAAAGSGMGSMTRTGISALFFLSGLRLGYWWNNQRTPDKTRPGVRWQRFWWKRMGKSRAALQEMLARFPGLESPVWYLSDGGHFDNTGVYSLLKRELNLIVLADCGADPHYVFSDLENLIRKARIDMDTAIDFIDPQSLPASLGTSLRNRFGTPDSITSTPSDQHLLLARIAYPSGASGCLLVVKPHLSGQLPLDVAGYADSHPDFPQQSTAEQFFDEAQWESYCQLGETLGLLINRSLMGELPAMAETGEVARIDNMGDQDAPAEPTRRQRISGTLGASLGLGVLATVALAGWQAWDSHATAAKVSEQVSDSQQRTADAIQIELESGAPFDVKLHARLYLLMQKFDDDGSADDLTATLHQLAQPLNHACAQINRSSPLLDRCLEDDSALHTAKTELTAWQKSMRDYVNAMHDSTISRSEGSMASGNVAATMQAVCNGGDLAQPQHIAIYTQISGEAPSKSALSLQKDFATFGLASGGVEKISQTMGDGGSQAPVAWGEPVFLYSSDSDQAQRCAQSLARWLGVQQGFTETKPRALAVALPPWGDTNAIEFFLPDLSATAR